MKYNPFGPHVKKLFSWAFGSNWERINHESRAVYINGKCIGCEHYITEQHKETKKTRIRWIPAPPI